MSRSTFASHLVLAAIATGMLGAALAKEPYTDPNKTDADFPYQGEYVGEINSGDKLTKVGVQVIALGKGKFEAVGHVGGLPGAGWTQDQEPVRIKADKNDQGLVRFTHTNDDGKTAAGVLNGKGELKVLLDGQELTTLKRVERKSPTLGQKPPSKAVVLFDGAGVGRWKGGKMTEDKLLMQGVTSKDTFGSHSLHIEFRLPYQPEARGQGRGNSGIYIQGRYECQMLDSFGLEGKQNECGGLYSVKAPDLNMCFPPLSWQTYDIDFTAAQYKDGELVANPRVTIRHNGVVIHDNVELPGKRNTTAAPAKAGPKPGPVYLQNHGNPVRYRNIWVVEK